jgi:predicted LPLAT superfamily acyltransferase
MHRCRKHRESPDTAKQAHTFMKERFYTILTALTDLFGTWLFALMARGIAAGYYICFPGRVAVSVRFYRALFPQRGRWYHLWCAWRQFQNFTSVYLDRYLMRDPRAIGYTFEGREHLMRAMRANSGGILLMSHMGNWEVGARLLRRDMPDLRLMLYIGQRARDQIERLQKQDLSASGIRIVAVDQEGGSAFDLVEGVAFLKSGGFVSMSGDMLWRPDQRALAARFLGHTVQLPEAPYMMALAAGAPLFIFFCSIKGDRQYHFCVSEPIRVRADTRALRRQAISQAAQAYAGRMETQLRRNPFEWYHFQPFLGPGGEPDDSHGI